MKFEQLLWYARRARTMENGELRARLAGALDGATDYVRIRLSGKSAYRRTPDAPKFAFCRSADPFLPDLSWNFDPAPRALAARLEGRHHALGFPWTWQPGRAAWHRAPDTGRLWPEKFSDLIDFRPGNPVGDVRVMWEPNRLQQLVALALVTRFVPARANDAAALLRRQLLSWLDANPMRIGVNYTCAMECALRILSVCFAGDLARRFLCTDDAFWTAVATIALEHADFVNARLSLFSSLGNHTVAEGAGLYVASLLFPEAPAAAAWERRAREVLERAAHRVVMADGGSTEQALHYHAQVLDLLEIALRVGRHFHRDVAALAAIHRRGAQFLARFHCDRNRLPRIGDDDDGCALSPHFAPAWAAETARAAPASSGAPISLWSGGGYSIVRIPSTRAELIFDHGPLGMAPNFGHGHADALAIHLSVGGVPVLIDPGTYCYGGEARWRSYFRSTAAHNTVTVDGQSQAREAGRFLWTSPYTSHLAYAGIAPEGAASLVAWHDGYAALGVRHTRAIRVAAGSIIVIDRLEGTGAHELALRWHFPETARRADGAYELPVVAGFRCVTAGGEAQIVEGSTAPPAGWRSERYGRKAPVSTLSLRWFGELPHEFVTWFALPDGDREPDLEQETRQLRSVLEGLGGPERAQPAGASSARDRRAETVS
jgi:hypothetical protein